VSRIESPARATIAVASGKGGVGKSTIALNLAVALAERPETQVGLLDADMYGPDIPAMVNVRRRGELRRWDLWRGGEVRLEPLERHGISLLSVGLLIGEHQLFPGAAPSIDLFLRQFLSSADWGPLDVLVIDLPPGTADLQDQLFRLIALDGVVIVVTPQHVAHLDAFRLVGLLEHARVPVLGAIENMAELTCPHCGGLVELLPRAAGERSIWSDGVRELGRLPFDPAVAAATEAGRPVVVADPDGETAARFRAIAARLTEMLRR
jgi:ATP-binding protein involved in chromosome partitioning